MKLASMIVCGFLSVAASSTFAATVTINTSTAVSDTVYNQHGDAFVRGVTDDGRFELSGMSRGSEEYSTVPEFSTLAAYWSGQVSGVNSLTLRRVGGATFNLLGIAAKGLFNATTISYYADASETGESFYTSLIAEDYNVGFEYRTIGGAFGSGSFDISTAGGLLKDFHLAKPLADLVEVTFYPGIGGDPCHPANFDRTDAGIQKTRFCELGFVDPSSGVDYYETDVYTNFVGRNLVGVSVSSILVSAPAAVPLPASFGLLGIGLFTMAGFAVRKRNQKGNA